MSIEINRLKKRSDFLAVAKGKRWNTSNFTLQANVRSDVDSEKPEYLARVGFTVTKKVGNSVVRNRVRRRLKSAVQRIHPELQKHSLPEPTYDYVLVARLPALTIDFLTLTHDLISAFIGVHRQRTSAKAMRG